MNAQFDLAADVQRAGQKAIQCVGDGAFAGILDRHDAEIGASRFHLLEHLIDRRQRQRAHRLTEMPQHRRLRKSAFGTEKGHLERLFLRQTGRHDLAEQPHHLFIAQRPGIALERAAQNFRLALGTVEIHRVAVAMFGNARLLRQPCALVQQQMQLLIDLIDARPELLESGRRVDLVPRPCGRRASLLLRAHAHHSGGRTSRADSTPSIARSRSISTSSAAPSASMSVKAYSPRERLSSSAIFSPAPARQVEICPTMFGTLLLAMAMRCEPGWRGSTASGKFTQLRMLPCSRYSRRVSATIMAQFSSASRVEAPRCGKVIARA